MKPSIIIYEKTMAIDCAIAALIKTFINYDLYPSERGQKFSFTSTHKSIIIIGSYWK